MKGRYRLAAVLSTALMMASTLAVLVAAPVAATSGRDSPATAMDANLGPFLGLTGGTSSPFVNPNPLAEDWYKIPVVPGQMLQVALLALAGNRVTLYHPDGCTATSCPNQIGFSQTGNDCGQYGFADYDMFIDKAETLYMKISPAANPTGNQPYNLAVKAYDLTEITSGQSYSPTPANDSIHGWAYAWVIGGTCGAGGGTIFAPMQFVSDYYWINVSDSAGPNHQNYHVQLSWTCQTAIYDLLLYQSVNNDNQVITLLNHSLGYQRREDRAAASTIPAQLDFAPALYDGRYLAQVIAEENGSFSLSSTARYNYQLSVNGVGGYAKDNNDRPDAGAWVNTSMKTTGRIDGRDDSGDWYRFSLNQNDSATMSVNLFRENNEINTWGQRYRALIFSPNGTLIEDHLNWGYSGNNPYFNPYLTVPSFTAPDTGTFTLLLQTADGGLNYRFNNNQPQLTGYTGRNWADYEINWVLPNRKPVQNEYPLTNMTMLEDTASLPKNLGAAFTDPEGKYGYPTFGIGSSPNFTFSTDVTGRNLTAMPKPDYCGVDTISITVRDDVPANSYAVPLILKVDCVNDAPRVYQGASADWSMVSLPEDAETTVPLRSIFYDVDDIDLNFTANGVSGGHLTVQINEVSKIVTIGAQPNWNGCQDLVWTARDPQTALTDFTTNVCVTALNDPPRATDRRLDRIVFNEGGEATVDLSGEFYDLDQGDHLYYYGVIDDPVVAQYVRINNSLLDPKDPYMRVYVIDSARADYFTDGPVQVRFMVFDRPMGDPAANWDPATGTNLQVEKTTFLEVLNVNDPPILDEYTPTPEEVDQPDQWHEGDTITFSVTDMKDPDHEQQFFYKWFVNDNEVPQEVSPTFVFRTVLDQTRPGQYAAGTYTVKVQVFDASQAKAIVEPVWTFTVDKTNRKPTVTILRPTNPTFEEGQNIQFQALASDEDPEDAANLEQNITWSYTDAAGARHSFGSGDRAERYLDPGTYEITVSAFDGSEYSNSTITLTVTEHKLNTPGFGSAGAAAGLLIAAVAVASRRRRKP